MGKNLWSVTLATVICLATLHVGVASAQTSVQVNQNGSPASGVNLSLMLNSIKTVKGTTGADGQAQVDEPAIAVGTTIQVVVRSCNGEISEVIHLPPNEVLPEDNECDDDPAGFYLWGQNQEIVVNVTPGGPVLTFPQPGFRPIWTFGAGADVKYLPNLEDQVCAQPNVTDCRVDDSGVGLSTYAEARVHPNFALGSGYSYAMASLDQHYTYQGAPVQRESDLTMNTFRLYARPIYPFGPPITLMGLIGWAYVWNKLESTEIGPGGDIADFDRDDSGGRLTIGADLDWSFTDRFGLRAGVNYTSGGSDDADTCWAFAVGSRVQFR